MRERPNILIFMTDQEQAQVTMPTHPCKTSNLDELAKEGIRFTSVYPPMAHCCPSRASFFTGLYPSQHGICNNISNATALRRSLNEDCEMFSDILKEAEYDLYFTGKWHVTTTKGPKDYSWKDIGAKNLGYRDWDAELEKYKTLDDGRKVNERKKGELLREGWGYHTLYGTKKSDIMNDTDVIDSAMKQIDELKESKEPWCLYIGTHGPHDPFIIPEKYAKMYNPADIQLPPNYQDDLEDKPRVYKRMREVWDQLSENEVKEAIAHYWGYCTYVDDMFGKVLKTLDETQQKDNTLVIFLSDHGEHAGAHGLFYKGISTFDEGYRVPCIMRWPNGIKNKGRVIDEFISITDFAPTFIELANGRDMNRCVGKSLVPFINDEKPTEWRDCIYTQCNAVEIMYTNRMVKNKKYKFVYNPSDIDELYDLENDPFELKNIIDDTKMNNIIKDMHRKMWDNAEYYEDIIFCPYPTASLAKYGPTISIKD